MSENSPLCACGCGSPVERNKRNKTKWNKFINYHSAKFANLGRIPWNKGIGRTPETKRKISEAHKGKIVSVETRQKISESQKGRPVWNKGILHSDEAKRKMSESAKGRKFSDLHRQRISASHKGKIKSEEHIRKISEANRGSKSPRWKGGITSMAQRRIQGLQWRQTADSIRERDGNTCVICGAIGGNKKFPVHHIIPFCISEDNEESNLVTLCPSCHPMVEFSFNCGDKGWVGYLRIKSGAIRLCA